MENKEFSCFSAYEITNEASHLLIAGQTGSGKSVLLNNIIYSLLRVYDPNQIGLALIDPKRVELCQYKNLPHTDRFATERDDIIRLLDDAIDLMERRYKHLENIGERQYNGRALYVIIDELADLMVTMKRDVLPRLQRLTQLGRAASVKVICCTQCPNRRVIPAEVTLNFTHKFGLHCDSAIESRQVIGMPGCELLPRYGQGILRSPKGIFKYEIPMYDEYELLKLIKKLEQQK